MYVLTQLVPRAETTDTILFYCADNRSVLEEILLSIYEEIFNNENVYQQYLPDLTHEKFLKLLKIHMDRFQIIYVPYLNS